MAPAARTFRTRLIASGVLARFALLVLGLGGIAAAWQGSDLVRLLVLRAWTLLLWVVPTILITALAVFALTLTAGHAVLRWRRRRQREQQAVLAQGAQQGRAALLEEVRIVVHGHLKPYVVEIERRLTAAREATDAGQRELLLRELDYSVQRLRQQIVGLHGQVAEPIPMHATALPDDLERTLREVTWNFRALLPRVTLEVAGSARPLPRRLVAALELLLYNALTNAHSHAQPQLVQVRLHYDLDTITLAVSDDGHGFDVARTRALARGRGLHDLEQTAAALGGRVEIFSVVGQGTEISMRLPLPRPALGWAASAGYAEQDKEAPGGRTNTPAPAMGAHSGWSDGDANADVAAAHPGGGRHANRA
jgi:signal transduction histidine kinase